MPLVAVFLFILETNLAILAGGLVIDNDQLTGGIDPQIVDGSGDGKVCRLVVILHSLEILAPDIKVLILEWNGGDIAGKDSIKDFLM